MTQSRGFKRWVFAAVAITILGYGATASCAGNAAALYSQRCVSCHGESGKGDGPAGKYLNPKPTEFGTSLKGKSDDWIAKAIKSGGPAVGEAPVMPAYGDLSDHQIRELVDYIKKLGS
jgi:mono/diheme cytochrome c family protein